MKLEQISKQNDDFRKTFIGGCIFLSPMVLALTIKERSRLLKLIKTCDNFKNDSHNLGEVKFKNANYLFIIDRIDDALILRIMHQGEI